MLIIAAKLNKKIIVYYFSLLANLFLFSQFNVIITTPVIAQSTESHSEKQDIYQLIEQYN